MHVVVCISSIDSTGGSRRDGQAHSNSKVLRFLMVFVKSVGLLEKGYLRFIDLVTSEASDLQV